MATSTATALDANSFLAAAGDAGRILDAIFKTAAISEILTIVNMVILATGTVWLTYNILAATVQSAWDGEFLGKRFHSVWMPIRLSIGFAALLPMFDGWGAAQVVLYQVAKMGAGAANIAVSGVVPKMTPITARDFVVGTSNATRLASDILDAQVCAEKVNLLAQRTASPETELGGGDWTRYYNIDSCIKVQPPAESDLSAAHQSAFSALTTRLRPLAARIAAATEDKGAMPAPEEIVNTTLSAAKDYEAAIKSAGESLASKKASEINSAIKAGNWMGYGLISAQKAAGQSAINTGTQSQPVVDSPSNNSSAGKDSAGKSAFSRAMDAVKGAASSVAGAIAAAADVFSQGIGAAFRLVLEKVFGKLSAADVKNFFGGSGDLVTSISGLGDWLLAIAIGITMAIGALMVIAIPLPPTSGILGIINLIIAVGAIIVIPLGAMGLSMSIYLPLVPAIFWTMAVIGWLLVIAEALFMAPIWAFAHLEAEGEGMGQRAEKGYAFVMNLLLRPLVLVFGFAIAGAILNTGWELIRGTIASHIAGLDLLSIPGIIKLIGYAFMMLSIATMLIYYVYGKAITVGDAIPAWLGTNFHNYAGHLGEKDPAGSAGHEIAGAAGRGLMGTRARGRQPDPGAGTDNEPGSGGGGGGNGKGGR